MPNGGDGITQRLVRNDRHPKCCYSVAVQIMSLKSINSKIKAVKKIRQVTRAMEAVSAVKMRRAQASAISGRPYALAALNILKRLSNSHDVEKHPLAVPRAEVKRAALVVITSDRGFAGGLNSAVLREASKLLKREQLTKDNTDIIAIGRKGRDFFERRGFTIHTAYEKWGEGVDMEDPRTLVERLISIYDANGFDKVYMVYTNFLSTLRQEPAVRTVLPVSFNEVAKIVEGIVPEKGKYAELKADAPAPAGGYLFEPTPEAVLTELIPLLLAIELYHAILEANASEHSARMVAMKSASDRALEVSKDLTRIYNRERQSKITSEISEIVTGVESMK